MYSMTGYGRGDLERDGRSITLEFKSVNHRYLDLAFRMPRSFAYLEDALRGLLQKELARGHVDVFVNYRNHRQDAKSVRVDAGLARGVHQALKEIALLTGLPNELHLGDVARFPDVLNVDEEAEDLDALRALTLDAAALALQQMKAMRQSEGLRLRDDVLSRLNAIEQTMRTVAARAPEVAQEYRAKLTARLAELLEGAMPDESRIVQEVAIYADHIAIDEEIARMASHIAAVREALADTKPAGRRLDFIVQEMNREANTIGSKASDSALIAAVLTLKSEIEKIREQVQNIE